MFFSHHLPKSKRLDVASGSCTPVPNRLLWMDCKHHNLQSLLVAIQFLAVSIALSLEHLLDGDALADRMAESDAYIAPTVW